MMRCRQLIGRGLRARCLSGKPAVGCTVRSIMTSLGMPVTRKVA